MILLLNLIFIALITFSILYIINKLLNVKKQSFKIISYFVIITSILINFILLDPNNIDYSKEYLKVIFLIFIIVFIIISYKMFFKKSLKDIINNKKTTFYNTEINHNYNTNIDMVDNSTTLNSSQTNNHLEQNNNVTNVEVKQHTNRMKKKNNFNNLNEVKLERLYKNLLKYDIINDNIKFNTFNNKFLKEPISFNNFSLPEYNLFFKKLKADFFINISDKELCKLFNLNNNSLKNSKKFKDYHIDKIEKIFEKV